MSEAFKNIPALLAWLDEQGWKVSKSTLYAHKKDGRLRPNSEGEFDAAEVEKYARRWLERKDGSPAPVNELDEIRARKERAAADREEYQARLAAVKAAVAEGRYVERGQVEHQLAARAAIFKSDGVNWVQANAGQIIAVVEGDPVKAPDLVEMMLKSLEAWLDRYSQPIEFSVPGAETALDEDDAL